MGYVDIYDSGGELWFQARSAEYGALATIPGQSQPLMQFEVNDTEVGSIAEIVSDVSATRKMQPHPLEDSALKAMIGTKIKAMRANSGK